MFKQMVSFAFLAACGPYFQAAQQPEAKQDVIEKGKEGNGLLPQKKIAEQKAEKVKHDAEEKKEIVSPADASKQLADNEALFQQKLKENQCAGGHWYKNNMSHELVSIRKAYPLMQQAAHKKAALDISHGLATLPDYAGDDFHVKHQYWSYKLYDLQKKVSPSAAKQLVCSLKTDLEYGVKEYSPYHGKKVSPLPTPTSTVDKPNWKARFAHAQKGWTHHNVESKNAQGLNWYKKRIQEEMEGLQKAYPKLQAQQNKKEALELFIALSEIHRFEHAAFLFQYLNIQHRLLELTGKVGHVINNDIVYTKTRFVRSYVGWEHN